MLGVDEVGYGAWAGPVVVCAVVAPIDWADPRVKDSKAYKGDSAHKQRRHLVLSVLPAVVSMHHLVAHDNHAIDRMGVTRARDDLVKKAVDFCLLKYPAAQVVMDGNTLPAGMPKTALCFPKADALVPAVSAASIFAKVWRDELMQELDEEYPYYDFGSNVGYGTPNHQAGLISYGPSPIHRRSYRNIREATTKSLRMKRMVARISSWPPPLNETLGSTRSNKP